MSVHLGLLLLALVVAVATQGEYGKLYGGDIILTPEQQAIVEATSDPSNPSARLNAVVSPSQLWHDGVVPYILDGSLNDHARTAIQRAITTLAAHTPVRFVPRVNQGDYVRFHGEGNWCSSNVGRIGGPQTINIGRGCETEGIVIHEMFHALGRWHEQSRPDRDSYVIINRANIQSGVEHNFDIKPAASTQGVPYDIRSIMHYGAYAFSRNNLPTIEPVDRNIPLSALGQRQGMTSQDVQHIKRLYCGRISSSASARQRRTRNCVCANNCAPLYRYWNPSVTDHFYTTNINEIGTATHGTWGHHGFISEGVQCFVYTSQAQGTVPLYRYWNGHDHFYTTNSGEIGTTTPGQRGHHGYSSEGVAGYCYPSAIAGTVPLYRYWKGDHFYTTNSGEIGTTTPGQVGHHGYISEGVACYVIALW